MTTFEMIVLKCPHCGTMMNAFDLMSYTVHRAENYSDGKSEAGVPSSDRIGICTFCNKPFWREDARLPYDPDWQPEEDLSTVMDMFDLEWAFEDEREAKTIQYYADLLEQGFANTDEKEFYLRLCLWWEINDLIRSLASWRNARNLGMLTAILNHSRKSKKLFKSFREIFDANLDRLIFLYIKANEIDLFFLAEMYRQRGNFSKAQEILDKTEKHGAAWRRLRKKIRRHNSEVYRYS